MSTSRNLLVFGKVFIRIRIYTHLDKVLSEGCNVLIKSVYVSKINVTKLFESL